MEDAGHALVCPGTVPLASPVVSGQWIPMGSVLSRMVVTTDASQANRPGRCSQVGVGALDCKLPMVSYKLLGAFSGIFKFFCHLV